MYTVDVPRSDVTSEEVSEALRNGLGPRYDVQPGMRMTQFSFGAPRHDQPDAILVSTGSNRIWRAQVRIIRKAGQTQIRVSPGGLGPGPVLINTFGIARKVRRVLSDAPALRSAA